MCVVQQPSVVPSTLTCPPFTRRGKQPAHPVCGAQTLPGICGRSLKLREAERLPPAESGVLHTSSEQKNGSRLSDVTKTKEAFVCSVYRNKLTHTHTPPCCCVDLLYPTFPTPPASETDFQTGPTQQKHPPFYWFISQIICFPSSSELRQSGTSGDVPIFLVCRCGEQQLAHFACVRGPS